MNASSSLKELKDIHLSKGISFFPLTPGWYILLLLLIMGAAGLIWWQLKTRKQHKFKLNIYKLLDQIEQQEPNSSETIANVSILLKRVATIKYPDQEVHTLFGPQWLEFLDRTGKNTDFTLGAGKSLNQVYELRALTNRPEFFNIIRKWLRTVL